MSVTPSLAFDLCWDVYQSVRADMDGIPLIDPTKVPSQHLWHPDSGPRASEFVADFALACQRALIEARDGRRLFLLCRVYYLGLTPYEEARRLIGIREDVFVDWSETIRGLAGRELMTRGLFPVRNYFAERSRPRRATGKQKAFAPDSIFTKRYGPSRKFLTASAKG